MFAFYVKAKFEEEFPTMSVSAPQVHPSVDDSMKTSTKS